MGDTRERTVGGRLNELLRSAGLSELDADLGGRFQIYLDLLSRWNAKVNLTAVRDEEGILSRHFVESIVCARCIPESVGTLLDFGSGGGFPGIPIALCRPRIHVTLAESQTRKAAFLNEAVRTLGLNVKVFSGRAERIGAAFDCVTLRAVDRMGDAVPAASHMVTPGGWLVLMVSGRDLHALQASVAGQFEWAKPIGLPASEDRLIALGERSG